VTRPLLILTVVFAAGLAVRAQNPVFSVRVESVRVDAMVTDKGQPVMGLTAQDFEILDNGVAQRIDTISFDEVPLNVVFAFDLSESVAGERLADLRAAGDAVLNGLKNGDKAGLVMFESSIGLGSGLTSDLAAVRTALADAAPDGNTSLIDGTFAALIVGESDTGRPLVIAFSDGLDTSSWLLPEVVLDTARRSDVVVYGVAVNQTGPEFLNEMATVTGGRVFEVEKTANLPAVFANILNEFRHRYLISYTPRGVAKGGWHRLTVRVKRNGTVKARPGYLGS
jgi:VWFA-related protein